MINLHKNHFNFMFKRYKEKSIPDFIQYLEQPWSEIFLHPFFSRFKSTLDILLNSEIENIRDLREKQIVEWPLEITNLIEDATIDFIKKNRQHFNNYLINVK